MVLTPFNPAEQCREYKTTLKETSFVFELGQNVLLKGMNAGQSMPSSSQHLVIVDCHKGDFLLHQGVHEMEQYFVLDGILKRVVPTRKPRR